MEVLLVASELFVFCSLPCVANSYKVTPVSGTNLMTNPLTADDLTLLLVLHQYLKVNARKILMLGQARSCWLFVK